MNIYEILSIFDKAFESDNTPSESTTKINGIDLKDVSAEDFEKTMKYLDDLKKNPFPLMRFLVSSDDIDKIRAELQAKWDIAHDTSEDTNKGNSSIDDQIYKLVDEYLANGIENDKDNAFISAIRPLVRESYANFAKFIYNK